MVGILIGPWRAVGVDAADTVGPSETYEAGIAPQEQEDYDPEANLPYLFAVYIITWGGFFAYVFYTSRRQREMEREIEALKATLVENQKASAQESESP